MSISIMLWVKTEVATIILNPHFMTWLTNQKIKVHFLCVISILDLLDHDFTVVGLTETWPSECDWDLYKLHGYSIVENHRESRVGGGVAICIQDQISVAKRNDISVYCSDIESVFVEIDKDQIGSSKNIVIGTIYRPPGHDIDKVNL